MAQDVGMVWKCCDDIWLVFEGSIPTCTCFCPENSFVAFEASMSGPYTWMIMAVYLSMNCISLTSQTHLRKNEKGLVNCIHTPCSATLSRITSLSSDSSLENGETELGHFPTTAGPVKHWLYFSENMLTPQQVIQECNFLKTGYVIQLIAFSWDTACSCAVYFSCITIVCQQATYSKNSSSPRISKQIAQETWYPHTQLLVANCITATQNWLVW